MAAQLAAARRVCRQTTPRPSPTRLWHLPSTIGCASSHLPSTYAPCQPHPHHPGLGTWPNHRGEPSLCGEAVVKIFGGTGTQGLVGLVYSTNDWHRPAVNVLRVGVSGRKFHRHLQPPCR